MTAILPIPHYPPIRGGLQSVSIDLKDLGVTEDEWRRGVTWQTAIPSIEQTFISGYGGGSWGVVAEGAEKPVSEIPDSYDFDPVSIGAVFACESASVPGMPNQKLAALYAERAIERNLWADLARIFWYGEGYPCYAPAGGGGGDYANYAIKNYAYTAAGYDDEAPGSIEGVFTGLTDRVCSHWHADPVFHVPRAYLPYFLKAGVKWDEEAGVFRYGPYLVSFDCYPNDGPFDTTTAEDGSEVWIYATMPPVYGIGGEIEIVSARNTRQNVSQVRAEQEAIIAFDLGVIIAGKAYVS